MAMANKLDKLTPAVAIHPGEVLQDELESRDIKQKDFAELTGIQPTQLNEIINGKRGINADLALIIGKALNMDARIWLDLQSNYEFDRAKINKKNVRRLEAIEQWQMMQPYIPEGFLKKKGYISGDPVEDVSAVLKLYDVHHFEQLAAVLSQPLYARLRHSEKLAIDKTSLIGWQKVVCYEASVLSVKPFDNKRKDELITSLRDIIYKNKNTLNQAKEQLGEFGIKLVFMDHPNKCAVDGFAFWSFGNPAIGLTLRYKRIDNFAFTIFHELGHIFYHLVNNNTIEFVDIDLEIDIPDKIKEEQEADSFARDNLINPGDWKIFFNSVSKLNDKSILNFARKERIHPAIVKGRLCHELNDYKFKSRIDHTIQ
jgi:HTH-type transcriptional regulator / antitoxin HigA